MSVPNSQKNMPKHKLFNSESSPLLLNNSTSSNTMTPLSNVHPALNYTVRPAVSKSKRMLSRSNISNPENTNISEHETIVNAQDSDSDGELHHFFSSSLIKLPYTKEEDELILKYVLKGENIFKVCSLSLWKHLESKKDNPKRTYQSLKNRFLRNIKPNLFTSYGHLIKNKATVDRILTKFPELKQKMNKRETLSRITLPERPKPHENDEVSSTSAHGSQENRVMTPGNEVDPVPVKKTNVLKEKSLQLKLSSDWYKPEICIKKVKLNKDGMTVWVNLMSRRQTSTSTLGIYGKYQALIEKNKLTLCPTCGRRNRPHKVTPLKSSKETDVLIPNSQETPSTSLKNRVISKSKRTPITKNILSKMCSPTSPSLLSSSSETEKCGGDVPQKPNEIPQTTEPSIIPDSRKNGNNLEVNVQSKPPNSESSEQECVSSNTRNSRSRTLKTFPEKRNTRANPENRVTPSIEKSNREERNATTSDKTFEATSSSSFRNSISGGSKRARDTDDQLDSIGEDAIANFRQLIDYEEEQLLVRKCLNKNFKSIGLEAVSHTNWDSYFLESSSDMGTPPLTIDYETDTQNNENEPATGTTTSGASFSNYISWRSSGSTSRRITRSNKKS